MPIPTARVHALLNPTSIAVVGASDESPWSRGFMKNLRSFEGPVFLVNPRRATAFGQPTYPSLRNLPQPVDHAVVLVAASRVPGVLRDAAASGIRSATVVASGFREAGEGGRALAVEVEEVADEHGIALVGPNCFGFNNYSGTYVSRYLIDVPNQPGAIGVVCQSGQLGAATADSASARGIHLRYLVSSGNEMVVDANDYFEYFLENDEIRVLGGVLERIPDPARFEGIARRALTVGKPLVVLKLGRSSVASRIAAAHTGAITGEDRFVDAYLRDLGIIRVSSTEELAETAGLLASQGWPKGGRTAFLGLSGGAAELFAEQADGTTIVLEPHSPNTRAELARVSGLDADVIHNPFDITVDGLARFAEIAETLAASGEFDVLVAQGQPRRSFEAPREPGEPDTRAALRETMSRGMMPAAERHGRFAVFLETGDTQPGIGVYEEVAPNGAHYVLGNNGVRSLANAIEYGIRRQQIQDAVKPPVYAVDHDMLPDFSVASDSLSEVESKALLRAYGIPVSEDAFAPTLESAVAAAEDIGYPVVLKVVAGNVLHKSDVGGVALGLRSAAEVREAFDSVLSSVRDAVPGADISGVIVSRQVPRGAEFIAGIVVDPALGPMVVAGLGGIFVEVFADSALLRPPFSADEARAALRSLTSARLLEGVRGGPPLDVDAFADVLCRVGQLALDCQDRLVALDVNPLIVLPAGEGVVAVDALAVVGGLGDSLRLEDAAVRRS